MGTNWKPEIKEVLAAEPIPELKKERRAVNLPDAGTPMRATFGPSIVIGRVEDMSRTHRSLRGDMFYLVLSEKERAVNTVPIWFESDWQVEVLSEEEYLAAGGYPQQGVEL